MELITDGRGTNESITSIEEEPEMKIEEEEKEIHYIADNNNVVFDSQVTNPQLYEFIVRKGKSNQVGNIKPEEIPLHFPSPERNSSALEIEKLKKTLVIQREKYDEKCKGLIEEYEERLKNVEAKRKSEIYQLIGQLYKKKETVETQTELSISINSIKENEAALEKRLRKAESEVKDLLEVIEHKESTLSTSQAKVSQLLHQNSLLLSELDDFHKSKKAISSTSANEQMLVELAKEVEYHKMINSETHRLLDIANEKYTHLKHEKHRRGIKIKDLKKERDSFID